MKIKKGDKKVKNLELEVASQKADTTKLMTKVIAPETLTWQDHPLVDRIWIDNNGVYHTDFDASELKITGKTYYVNNITGSDSTGDGLTLGTPLKRIYTAYAKSDVKVIVPETATTYYYDAMNTSDINKSISIIPFAGSRNIIVNSLYAAWTKTAGQTNVYQKAFSDLLTVIDVSRTNTDSSFLEFASVDSVANCDSAEDTYYTDGTTLYVHVKGGITPSGICYAIKNNTYALTINLTLNKTVYLENLDIIGGIDIKGTGTVVCKNCTFQYGWEYNVKCLGATLYVITQGCKALKSETDGFSFNTGCHFIEINNDGSYNGNGATGTQNGSTAHGGSLGMRLNCGYYYNHGPNIGDVQANTQTWNMGCKAFNPTYTGEVEGTELKDFNCQDETAEAWYEGCECGSLWAGGSAKIHVKNTKCKQWKVYTETASIDEY